MLDHFVQKCMIVDFEISLDPIVHFRTLQSFRTVRFRDIGGPTLECIIGLLADTH